MRGWSNSTRDATSIGRERDGVRCPRNSIALTSRGGRLVGPSIAALISLALTAGFAGPALAQSEGGAAAAPPNGPSGCPYDFDCDGLSDSVEDQYSHTGLSRSNPDSDFDGLNDGDEFYNRTGWTYPNIFDSDGDGLGDGDEFFIHGTRNDAYDTDGDGWSDGDEVRAGRNPNGHY